MLKRMRKTQKMERLPQRHTTAVCQITMVEAARSADEVDEEEEGGGGRGRGGMFLSPVRPILQLK